MLPIRKIQKLRDFTCINLTYKFNPIPMKAQIILLDIYPLVLKCKVSRIVMTMMNKKVQNLPYNILRLILNIEKMKHGTSTKIYK